VAQAAPRAAPALSVDRADRPSLPCALAHLATDAGPPCRLVTRGAHPQKLRDAGLGIQFQTVAANQRVRTAAPPGAGLATCPAGLGGRRFGTTARPFYPRLASLQPQIPARTGHAAGACRRALCEGP